MLFKSITLPLFTALALNVTALPVHKVHAQSFFPGFGGSTPGQCEQKCKDVKKQCEKDIDRLKSACKATGRTLLCDRAKDHGCKASQTYCERMELVSFQDSACDPPIPPEFDPTPDGSVSGEPHFITFDGLLYDLQSAGDMVLAETDDGRFAAHVRLSPLTNSTSVQTAVGLRFNDLIISYDNRDATWRASFDGPDSGEVSLDLDLFAKGPVSGVLISRPRSNIVRLVHPDLATVTVILRGAYINVSVNLPGDPPTHGLLGNNDQNAANDLIPAKDQSYWDWIHGTFTDTWRLTQNSPLLPYREGESAGSFAIADHPQTEQQLQLSDLQAAAEICDPKGLLHPWDTICIHDVAITQDSTFSDDLNLRTLPNVVTLPAGTGGLISKVKAWVDTGTFLQARLVTQDTAETGETVTITWQGPNEDGDYIAIAKPDAPASERINRRFISDETALSLEMPGEPGRYELRYVFAKSGINEDDEILAREIITVKDATAMLQAPTSALIGQTVSVDWQGPDQKGDYISIAMPGDVPFKNITREFTRKGTPVDLIVPGSPGTYELRYVLAVTNANSDDVVLAQTEILVAPTTATIDPLAPVAAGETTTVQWTGPGFANDYIAIAEVGAKPFRTISKVRVTAGETLSINAPDQPGTYEIRYVLAVTNANGDDVILATQPLEVQQ